ncbi:hypothetical protein E4K10_32075 [Streptomyces sp. T1317-0309]|nr:hypothetical protein E4K10_32075 [Streptomyces sp. T1317-0309]
MTSGTPVPPALTAWAENIVGPLRTVRDVSHPRPESQVWELTSATGRTVLKVAPTPVFYARETRAYREAAPALERGTVPHLVESDARHRALLMTAVPGRPVRSAALSPPWGAPCTARRARGCAASTATPAISPTGTAPRRPARWNAPSKPPRSTWNCPET